MLLYTNVGVYFLMSIRGPARAQDALMMSFLMVYLTTPLVWAAWFLYPFVRAVRSEKVAQLRRLELQEARVPASGEDRGAIAETLDRYQLHGLIQRCPEWPLRFRGVRAVAAGMSHLLPVALKLALDHGLLPPLR
jgi:hypothetical protein